MDLRDYLRSSRTFAAALALAAAASLNPLAGCSPSSGTAKKASTNGSTYQFVTPTLTSIAPTTAALGDTVQVFGQNFIDPKHGTLALYMQGTFTDANGNQTPYTSRDPIPLTVSSAGQASFVFGPDVFFSPTGQDMGTFQGNFQVISTLAVTAANGQIGDSLPSATAAYALTVAPSLYIDQLRSVDDTCNAVTNATVGSQNVAIGVHAIGMADATADTPITYNFIYDSSSVLAAFAPDTTYGTWPIAGVSEPNAQVVAPDGTNSFSFQITEGTGALVDPQNVEQSVTVSPPVMMSDGPATDVQLAAFGSQANNTAGAMFMTVSIQAVASDGSTVSRTINMPVYNQIEVEPWNGTNQQIVQIFPPEAADLGCSSGGLLGTNIQYSEGSSETKNRGVSMNWNINNSLGLTTGMQFGGNANAGLNFGLVSFGVMGNLELNNSQQMNWSQTFAVDNNWSVSTTSQNNSTLSVQVPPDFVAMSYRQATQLERTTNVNYHNACGVSSLIGQAVLTDWAWGFDVAQGPTCPPPTKLSSFVCGGDDGAPPCQNN